tara:strand:- start:280 stop:720 length:441 start_codon:yes stop_codon:yes gene_type:complete
VAPLAAVPKRKVGFNAEVSPAKAAAGATVGLPYYSSAAGLAAVRAAVKEQKAARGAVQEEEERATTDSQMKPGTMIELGWVLDITMEQSMPSKHQHTPTQLHVASTIYHLVFDATHVIARFETTFLRRGFRSPAGGVCSLPRVWGA